MGKMRTRRVDLIVRRCRLHVLPSGRLDGEQATREGFYCDHMLSSTGRDHDVYEVGCAVSNVSAAASMLGLMKRASAWQQIERR